MPRPVVLDGKPDDPVYTHIQMPCWLKARAAKEAANRGLNLTSYVISLLTADLGVKK